MHDDIKTVLLTKEEIDARVQEMGKQIAADYAGKELVVIVLLKGAAWFATDLTRAIDMPLRVDFMVASSYGNGTSTSGSVKVKLDVSEDIKGKDVLVIDDIIDSGVTFASITDMLRHYKPATLKTAALCDKAERRDTERPGVQTCVRGTSRGLKFLTNSLSVTVWTMQAITAICRLSVS